MPVEMLRARLADERGIALVMTLMVLTVLTILGASMLTYTNANGHSAQQSQARSNAWAVAEAGVAQAFSVLANSSNDANKSVTLPPGACSGSGVTCYTCGSTSCFKATTPSGYALWSGVLKQDPNSVYPYWIVTSTGYITNTPSGAPASKTAIVKIPITWSLTGPLNNPAWSEIMSTHPPSANGVCDETIQQSVTIASPFYVMGNLCLQNGASVTQGPMNVVGSIWLQQPSSIIGTKNGSGSHTTYTPISELHIGGQCQYQNNGFHNCGTAQNSWASDNIFGTIEDNSPASISPPVISWDGWYKDASPGPYQPCSVISSGPVPTFENETVTYPPNATLRNNSLANTPFNLTPTTSYDCKTDAGELKWDATNDILTVSGAIFIDGSAYIIGPTGGFTATYTGQAALYLSGDFFMKNAILCAVLTANKKDCNSASWNPNSQLIAIMTNGEGGQPSTNMNSTDGAQFVSSIFQGAVYATYNISTDTTSKVYGPMLGSAVNLGQSVNTVFPAINVSGFWLNTNNAVYAQPQPPVYLNG